MASNNCYDVTTWPVGNPSKDVGEVLNSIIADIKDRQTVTDANNGGQARCGDLHSARGPPPPYAGGDRRQLPQDPWLGTWLYVREDPGTKPSSEDPMAPPEGLLPGSSSDSPLTFPSTETGRNPREPPSTLSEAGARGSARSSSPTSASTGCTSTRMARGCIRRTPMSTAKPVSTLRTPTTHSAYPTGVCSPLRTPSPSTTRTRFPFTTTSSLNAEAASSCADVEGLKDHRQLGRSRVQGSLDLRPEPRRAPDHPANNVFPRGASSVHFDGVTRSSVTNNRLHSSDPGMLILAANSSENLVATNHFLRDHEPWTPFLGVDNGLDDLNGLLCVSGSNNSVIGNHFSKYDSDAQAPADWCDAGHHPADGRGWQLRLQQPSADRSRRWR